MKYPNSDYFVEVKDHHYIIHPTENTFLRKQDPPKSNSRRYSKKEKSQSY